LQDWLRIGDKISANGWAGESFNKMQSWDGVQDKICGYGWGLGKLLTLCRPLIC